MKIGEAQKQYSSQINTLWNRKQELLALKKDELAHSGSVSQALLDELQAVSDEHEKMSAFMEEFTAYRTALQDAEAARQQGEAGQKYAEDLVKYMEIARRLSRGDRVPASDEEKLMNFNMEMYIAAKNAGMVHANKNSKEYDSLWNDEEETDSRSASEIVDDRECSVSPDFSTE